MEKVKTFSWLALCIACIIMMILQKCSHDRDMKNLQNSFNNNLIAMSDTVRVHTDKLGRKYFESSSFVVSSMDDLKLLNSSLWNEVSSMKTKISSLSAFSMTYTSKDTLVTKDTSIVYLVNSQKDTVLKSSWNFLEGDSSNYFKVSGFSLWDGKSFQHSLTERTLRLNVITGIYKENGISKIYVKSESPFVTIGDIKGAILEEPKLKWYSRIFIGPTFGYGVNLDGKFRPQFGFSLGYNILPIKLKSNKKRKTK